mmetsp:Transcript_102131/g.266526  ORF Transcript_102131/g.266526 Transcript_102131/m.266526 type:complete len:353 (+) Transcript_102131:94-1152(+)
MGASALWAAAVASSLSASAALTLRSGDAGLPKFLAVTGYWRLTGNDSDQGHLRTGPGGYMKQMQYSCTLNTPMVFYGDAFGIENMLAARGDAQPPALGATEVNFSSFEPCASHGDMMRQNPTFWTHPRDCPSISLGCVWDGKISVLSRAAREHPDYDLYAWVDVGMHASGTSRDVFRSHDRKPWPHPKKLAMLPLDKISISHSDVNCKQHWNEPFSFWHCAAATAFVVPRSLVSTLEKLFYRKLQECIEYWEHRDRVYIESDNASFGGYGCLSEQMILSVIARNQPRLFNWVGQGWGRIAANLTTDAMDFAKMDNGAEDILGWLASADDEEEGSSATMHRLAAGPAVRVKMH